MEGSGILRFLKIIDRFARFSLRDETKINNSLHSDSDSDSDTPFIDSLGRDPAFIIDIDLAARGPHNRPLGIGANQRRVCMCVDADSSTRRVRVPRYRYPESGCSSTGGAGPASIREYPERDGA